MTANWCWIKCQGQKGSIDQLCFCTISQEPVDTESSSDNWTLWEDDPFCLWVTLSNIKVLLTVKLNVVYTEYLEGPFMKSLQTSQDDTLMWSADPMILQWWDLPYFLKAYSSYKRYFLITMKILILIVIQSRLHAI